MRPACSFDRAAKGALASCAALLLAACATAPEDGGFGDVAAAARAHLGKEVRWPRSEEERARSDVQVARVLAQPLAVDDAVQVALLNNRGLQASFEALGISAADLAQSGRLPNPRFTLRHAAGAGQSDVEQILTLNLLALATAPISHDIEKRRFAQAQEYATLTVMRLAAAARRAYFMAVAAAESVRYFEQVRDAAESGAELARRMQAAGNWSALEESRERGFRIAAVQNLAAARLAETETREALVRLLGLDSDSPPLRLADRLPELPTGVEELPAAGSAQLHDRIDLRLQRRRLDELAHALDLVKATRMINVLEGGPARIRQGEESSPYEHGYEVAVEVPIFDGGAPRVHRAEAIYSQAVDRYAQACIDARSEIRAAAAAYQAAYGVAALQRAEGLPRVKSIAAEDLKRYYTSQASIFDLLADARAEIGGVETYIRQVRDFWIAKSDLDAALLGGSSHVDP